MKTFLKFLSGMITGLLLGAPIVALAAAFLVGQGGTGKQTFLQGLIYSPGGTTALTATSSGLTIDHIYATSTSATSTFAYGLNVTSGGCVAVRGTCIGGTGTVTNIATTFPILGGPITTTGTLTFGGLSTTTTWTQGNLVFASGPNMNQVGTVATGTVSAGSSQITVTAGRSVIGGALAIDCATATAGQSGCLSSTDWSTFNNKGAGSVTSIIGGTGLSGGTITTSGTLALKSYFGTSTADTTGQVLYWNSTGATPSLLTSSANMTFDGTKLTLLAASTTNESISNFFQAPNGTSITLGTAGTIAVNTTAASTSIQAYGAAQMGAYQVSSVSWLYPTSTPVGTTTQFIQLGPRGQTFASMACDTDAGTALVVIGTGSASSTIVLASSTAAVSVALSSNNTFQAWQRLYVSIGSWTTTATGVVTCGFGRKYDY